MSKKELATKQNGNMEAKETMNRMFGGGVQIPVDAPLPVITIMRESAQFEMPDGRYEKTFTGHILHWHNANQYYKNPYGEGDSHAPDCCSSDGLKPDGGQFPQDGLCCDCDMNRWGSGKDGYGKACQNTIRLYVLTDGEVIPSILKAPPSSLGPKDALMRWLTSAPNTAARAGAGTNYQPIQVKFSLRKKEFASGLTASIVQVETVRVIDIAADAEKLQQLGGLYGDFMANYMGRVKADVAQEGTKAG